MARAASLSVVLSGARAPNVSYLGAARCRRKFELFYPDGFLDHAYLVAERAAKERAHLEWRSELGPVPLRKRLARGDFRAVADAALRIEARCALLSPFERIALRDAVSTTAGARLFTTELQAFLWGGGTLQRRFEDWVEAVGELPRHGTRVLSWPVVTVFGFIARPDRHLIFKPRVTRRAAHDYGFDLGYAAQPSWAGYQSLQTFAAVVRRDLERRHHLRPRDLIDVQSFLWVQGADEYEA